MYLLSANKKRRREGEGKRAEARKGRKEGGKGGKIGPKSFEVSWDI